MSIKRALIVGHTGQDGFYLKALLQSKGYLVFGLSSREIDSPGIDDFPLGSVLDKNYIHKLIRIIMPDEVYYLAAVHGASASISQKESIFEKSLEINTIGVYNVLDSISKYKPTCTFFYASSSHVFGKAQESPQSEKTPMLPNCVYGITKAAGMGVCRFFAEKHNIVTITGIFYNHESERRLESFVTKKIVKTAIDIKQGRQDNLVLGNISSSVDWGFAPDYMEAIYLLTQHKQPGDYIIATNTLRTIEDFLNIVFNSLDLNWKDYVKVDPNLFSSADRGVLRGDYSKLNSLTKWEPHVTFEQMALNLVEAEIGKN